MPARTTLESIRIAILIGVTAGGLAHAGSSGGDVTVVLSATAGDPIEQNNLSQTTPIFTTPIGADGLFSDVLANPIVGGPILTIDAADVSGDADPFIDLGFTVTNTTGFEAEVVVTSFVPLSEVFGPGLRIGASASMSVTDPASNGFLLGPAPGASLFEGAIDGEIVTTFFSDGASGPISQPGGGVDSAGFFAFPVDDVLHADAIAETSIGITSRFVLGPGDVTTFNGSFSVTPVIPEPSAACLVIVAAGAAASRRSIASPR